MDFPIRVLRLKRFNKKKCDLKELRKTHIQLLKRKRIDKGVAQKLLGLKELKPKIFYQPDIRQIETEYKRKIK